MEKVLITGGTGFIGRHLVERNLKAGNIVSVLATSDNSRAEELALRGIEIFYGDMRNIYCATDSRPFSSFRVILKKRMKSDGNMTKRERARLTKEQNRTSRNIYRLKHNNIT